MDNLFFCSSGGTTTFTGNLKDLMKSQHVDDAQLYVAYPFNYDELAEQVQRVDLTAHYNSDEDITDATDSEHTSFDSLTSDNFSEDESSDSSDGDFQAQPHTRPICDEF